MTLNGTNPRRWIKTTIHLLVLKSHGHSASVMIMGVVGGAIHAYGMTELGYIEMFRGLAVTQSLG